MPRWKYKRKIIDVWLGVDMEDMEKEPLDELGSQGWEIISVVPVEGIPKTHIAYCKKAIKESDRKDLIATKDGFKLKE